MLSRDTRCNPWFNSAMGRTDDQVRVNLAYWEESVGPHLESYGAAGFATNLHALSSIVRMDRRLMAPYLPDGSVSGLSMAHLQCHIGTDSLSWARLGASVVGIDYSSEAVAAATSLAEQAGLSERVRFVHSWVEDAPAALPELFDIVYTSVGVLIWLPDLAPWARSIAALLKPGGLFYIREAHPMAYILDADQSSGALSVATSYFNDGEPLIFEDAADYTGAALLHNRTYEWQHPLSEIIGCLLDAGLRIEGFAEHQWVDWQLLPTMVPSQDPALEGTWVLPSPTDQVPLSFTLAARR